VVSRTNQGCSAYFDRQVGADGRCQRAACLRAKDENQMGKLQPRFTQRPIEHRSREETTRMPGIHRRPRNGSHAGADSQCPLRRPHGSTHTALARVPGRTESVARLP